MMDRTASKRCASVSLANGETLEQEKGICRSEGLEPFLTLTMTRQQPLPT